MSHWILKVPGKDRYFREMTWAGARCTKHRDDALWFDTREQACRSPAYLHPLSAFEPIEVTSAETPK